MKVDLEQLPKARMEFVEPMLAKPSDHLPSGRIWSYELKLDGYRSLVMKHNRRVTLFSRRGNSLNGKVPTIATAFSFLPEETIVDGELVVLDDTGRPSFSALQNSRFTPDALYFYVFDLLVLRGRDLRKLPLRERRRLLEREALKDMRDPVRLSVSFNASANDLVAAAKKAGLEGVIAKRTDTRYENGERSGAKLAFVSTRNGSPDIFIMPFAPGDMTAERVRLRISIAQSS